jgi:branched-chain amino acid transport system permease protein
VGNLADLWSYIQLPLSILGVVCLQAMGLQLILGGAGLLSLGHAAFSAAGGYAAGAVSVFLLPRLGFEPLSSPLVSLFCCLFIGVGVAGLLGFLVAVPCLRLQGDYLAMATLGFGEIVVMVLKNLEVVGGTRGFKDIPKLTNLSVLWACVVIVAVLLHRFFSSPIGLAIQATRDDEIAARSLGISTHKSKMVAFVIGASLAGLGGAFQIHGMQFMSPDAADFARSVEILLAVVIGGMYSLRGSLLGALILVAVPELLRFAPAAVSENRMLAFSLVVIVLMVMNPKGLSSFIEKCIPKALRGAA